jgi:hypothetical protein
MRALPFVLVLACSGDPGPIDTSGDADTDADTDTDTDTDTDPPGTDADGDGFTVEEGDCDDTTIYVNPAWDEDTSDDVDNDCDGRIDEVFSGVVVFDNADASRLQWVSSFGDDLGTQDLGAPLLADCAVERIDGDGWVVTDGTYGTLTTVDPTGTTEILWDAAAVEWDLGDEPLGLFGLARHPDGYYLATGGDRLWRIEADGTYTELAQWACFEEDGTTELCALSVAVDALSGQIAMFGYFGAFATWSAAEGLTIHVPENADMPTHQFFAAKHRHAGSFFGLGLEVSSGAWGVWRWDDETGALALKGAWPNGDYVPTDLDIDDETGDFYLTANGGWYYTVYRMLADGSQASQLFTTDGSESGRQFGAIATVWEQD